MPDPLDVSPPSYKEVNIGFVNSFTNLPCSISIEDENYFLNLSKTGQYHLLSAVCPHMWGNIVLKDACFLCPDHGWQFDLSEGICTNGPRSRMYKISVINRQGVLFAQFPYQ